MRFFISASCFAISTHALTEGDYTILLPRTASAFQLTPSRRATGNSCYRRHSILISTHALTEGDNGIPKHRHGIIFQLTPSRRATISFTIHCFSPHPFQLTPSRRATTKCALSGMPYNISTHALTEGDRFCPGYRSVVSTFQLTPSRRATFSFRVLKWNQYFNSRPHGGRPPLTFQLKRHY